MAIDQHNILDDFDPIKMTATVGDLLFSGRLGAATSLLDDVVNRGLLPAANRRITNGRMRIKSVAQHIKNVEKLAKEQELTLAKKTAEIFDPKVSTVMPRRFTSDMKQGAYEGSAMSSIARRQDDLTKHCQHEDLALFKKFGFERKVSEVQADRLYVGKNCRFSYLPDDAMTVLIDDTYTVPAMSGRVAKSTGVGIYRDVDQVIEEALVLPFPHKAGNFYHALSEMVYGLRHAGRVGENVPIIHGEDRFGLLPVICDMIDLDAQRLLPVEKCADLRVTTAYMPLPPSFYWNTQFVQFFRKAALRRFGSVKGPKKFYISRSRSARSTPGELDFEAFLQSKGYEIVHAQDLKFSEQIRIFMSAEKIIAPHGAGLTNMAFCNDDVEIIEVFSSNMLQPDFYQRSKFVTNNYQCVIVDDYRDREKISIFV